MGLDFVVVLLEDKGWVLGGGVGLLQEVLEEVNFGFVVLCGRLFITHSIIIVILFREYLNLRLTIIIPSFVLFILLLLLLALTIFLMFSHFFLLMT